MSQLLILSSIRPNGKTELHFDQFMRLEKNVSVGLDSFCGQVSYNNLNIH